MHVTAAPQSSAPPATVKGALPLLPKQVPRLFPWGWEQRVLLSSISDSSSARAPPSSIQTSSIPSKRHKVNRVLPEPHAPFPLSLYHLFSAKLLDRVVYTPWIHSFPAAMTVAASAGAPHPFPASTPQPLCPPHRGIFTRVEPSMCWPPAGSLLFPTSARGLAPTECSWN